MKALPFVVALLCTLASPSAYAEAGRAKESGESAGGDRLLQGERVATFSVRNQPVQQVILAFAEKSGLSVVTDASVTGSISLVLHDMPAEDVLQEIAAAGDLFLEDRHGLYRFSRVRFRSSGNGTVVLQSRGGALSHIVATVARDSGINMVVTSGFDGPVICSATGTTVQGVLQEAFQKLPVTVVDRGNSVLIHDAPKGPSLGDRPDQGNRLDQPSVGYETGFRETAGNVHVEIAEPAADEEPNQTIHLSAWKTTDRDILQACADASGAVLVAAGPFLSSRDILELTAPNWQELDRSIEAVMNLQIRREGNLFLAQSSGRTDAFAGLRKRVVIPTVGLSPPDVRSVLSSFPALSIDWTDPEGERAVVCGFTEDITRAQRLIAELLASREDVCSFTYRCTGNSASRIAESLAVRFDDLSFRVDGYTNTICAALPASRLQAVDTYARHLDGEQRRLIYRCRYTPPDEALRRIQAIYPGVTGVDGVDEQTLVLDGPSGFHRDIQTLLGKIDRPFGQIRYDICIIQYHHGNSRQHGIQASFDRTKSTASVFSQPIGIAANYDRVTSLQFDLLSAMGYQAFLGISEELNNNTARLLIDTTINGREGIPARLENASTFRYRDVLGNDESDGYRAVTREIDTGLIVELTGRIRDDRTISVDINVTISKNGTDMTGNGNPPATSRKLIETNVVVEIGEPVVVGGLLHREAERAEHRFPLLGKVPLLRRLVNGSTARTEETEFVLYLSAFPDPSRSPRFRKSLQLQELQEFRRNGL